MFATLVTITFVVTLVRTLGGAASGNINIELVIPMVFLSTLNTFPLILALTAFLAVLIPLSRAWRESELVVWFASGVGPSLLFATAARFILPMIIAVGFTALFLGPWAQSQTDELRARFAARADLHRVVPGQFREGTSNERVIFVENASSNSSKLGRVFVFDQDSPNIESVLLADDGVLLGEPDGAAWLILKDGSQSRIWSSDSAEGLKAQVLNFDEYRLRVDFSPTGDSSTPTIRGKTTLDLLTDKGPLAMGELSYRLGLPIFALLFATLAIPLSVIGHRTGSSWAMLTGFLIGMFFNNLLILTQTQIARGKIDFIWGWWPSHLLLLLIVLILVRFQFGLVRSPIDRLWLAYRRLTFGV